MLDKVNDGADDQPGEETKIREPDISVFGLQQIGARVINVLDNDLVGGIRVIHGLFEIPGIFLIWDIAIIAEKERAVIRVIHRMFSAVKHFYFSDDGQECEKDREEQ